MTRSDRTPYGARREWKAPAGYGIPADRPQEGFYRFKPRAGAVYGGVRVIYGPPLDPVTGEELDRSWRWYALFNGEPIDLDVVWPVCAGNPITEDEYRRYVARQGWAREHAPDSAYAERGRKIDPLSLKNPLPF